MKRPPSAAWPIVRQGLMALGMSAAVSGAVTYLNTGWDADFFARRIAVRICTSP